MQEKIKTIRQECIKENPSILDLKFGCVVKVHNKDYGDISIIIKEPFGKFEIFEALTDDCIQPYLKEEIQKILGQPIRLGDIVMATMKKMDGKTKAEVKEVMMQYAYLWNCLSDDLNDQFPEAIDFIYNLLK